MKNILTTILISILVSFITLQAITFFDLPFWKSYSGQIVKDTSTKVVQEKIEEYKKTNSIESNITAAIEQWSPSVVSIVTSKDISFYLNDALFYGKTPQLPTPTIKSKNQKIKTGWASWIIISKDGYIITNKHVVEDLKAEYSIITKDWDTLSVKNIRRDPVLDIAVIQAINDKWELPTDLQPAKFISYTSPVHIWQFTIAIGNALTEYSNTATFGIISAKNRSIDTQSQDEVSIGLYQTDTPINPGNSWWPLLNTAWEVLGINTASKWEWIGFTLPLSNEFIQATLASLNTGGTISRPYIGIQTKLLTKAAAKNLDMKKFEWVYIESVKPNSPAQSGWLLSGDIITEINNTTIQSDMPLLYTIYTFKPTEKISLLIYRNKEYKKFDITLGGLGDIVQ
jgi:serine protease Do